MAITISGTSTAADLVALGCTKTSYGSNKSVYYTAETVQVLSGGTLTLRPGLDLLVCYQFWVDAGGTAVFDGEYQVSGASRFDRSTTVIATRAATYTTASVRIDGTLYASGGRIHCYAGFYIGGAVHPRQFSVSGEPPETFTSNTATFRSESDTGFDAFNALNDPNAGFELIGMNWHLVGRQVPRGLKLSDGTIPVISSYATNQWIEIPAPALDNRGGERTFNFWSNKALSITNPVNGASGLVTGSHQNGTGGSGVLRAICEVTPVAHASIDDYRIHRVAVAQGGNGLPKCTVVFTKNSTIGTQDCGADRVYNALSSDGAINVTVAMTSKSTGGYGVAPISHFCDPAPGGDAATGEMLDRQTFRMRSPEMREESLTVLVRSGAQITYAGKLDAGFTGTREQARLLYEAMLFDEASKTITVATSATPQEIYNAARYYLYTEVGQDSALHEDYLVMNGDALALGGGWAISGPVSGPYSDAVLAGYVQVDGVLTGETCELVRIADGSVAASTEGASGSTITLTYGPEDLGAQMYLRVMLDGELQRQFQAEPVTAAVGAATATPVQLYTGSYVQVAQAYAIPEILEHARANRARLAQGKSI